MQTTRIPVCVLDDVNHHNRDFLWTRDGEKRVLCLVSWGDVWQPKLLGGLGIMNPQVWNECFLAKLSLRLLKEPNALWCKVLVVKYNALPLAIHQQKPSSSNWKGLLPSFRSIADQIVWQVGDGIVFSFRGINGYKMRFLLILYFNLSKILNFSKGGCISAI